ncbi:succinate dehydrogenase cytochrome b subunit [Corynebacterium uterequi]|uniref:Succinate dehydrogenase/fumarate reductase cytochrome b subunit, b558 family n=1 Tax=Corynebacterium uterequi TaxID=1072256 RepID=A0A0G3HGJ2_9CORY|nr:succinate dehydrogenase cytochrome b subunit [Corynebacterium uterequi]AKK10242.1 succinate dehydrogenase/fumarate reductase cytochrome b subunit, b558 family [Corynebacterium uterequi]
MTVKDVDREAIRHGKITEQPLRERPAYPTWAMKLVMAVTGLIFALFVVFHMVGNLKVFLPDHDGVPAINVYGEWLRSLGEPLLPHEGFLWIFRVTLLTALILHVHGAITLHARSRKSRGKFSRTNLMGGLDSSATRSMLITGVLLLAFVIFHLLDLTMGVAPAAPESFVHGEIQNNMVATFSRWPVTIFYVVAMLGLFMHLYHGIRLMASDLGITGHKGMKIFAFLAAVIPALTVIANIIMPVSIALGVLS